MKVSVSALGVQRTRRAAAIRLVNLVAVIASLCSIDHSIPTSGRPTISTAGIGLFIAVARSFIARLEVALHLTITARPDAAAARVTPIAVIGLIAIITLLVSRPHSISADRRVVRTVVDSCLHVVQLQTRILVVGASIH
jgi:hypothetical protein